MNLKSFWPRRKPGLEVSHLVALGQKIDLAPKEVFAFRSLDRDKQGVLILNAFIIVIDRLGDEFIKDLTAEADDFPAIVVVYSHGPVAVVSARAARWAQRFYEEHIKPARDRAQNKIGAIGPTRTVADIFRIYDEEFFKCPPPD